jgi:hypothetical protein
MAGKVVTPKFSEKELSEIDERVNSGDGRCRSDFVRKVVLYYIRDEKEIKL